MYGIKVKLTLNTEAFMDIDAWDMNMKSRDFRELSEQEQMERVQKYIDNCPLEMLPRLWTVESIEE